MRLFISYRRSDSQDIAARLAERLADAPGIREVFIDVDGIVPGANFATRIGEALAASDACLILIGRDWAGTGDGQGPARIAEAGDFVHREVASALASGKRVLPVLLNGAAMPAPTTLPEDIRTLASLNAVFVRHTSFNQDLELLLDALFGDRPRGPAGRFMRRHPGLGWLIKAGGGALAAAIVLTGVAAVHSRLSGGRALEQTLGGAGMVWLLILATLGLGAGLALWLLRRR